jgi:LacI family transcriptional regulator/LacI family purine nucleotide synthesis repressor
MQDIANALGISKNAVSLALNNKPGISESLRSKVIETAIFMNYGGYGKLGVSLESKLVAICVPSAISGFSQFYSSIYWSVEKELAARGYRPLLTSVSTEMEESLVLPPVLQDREAVGVVVVGILSKQYISKIAATFEHLVLVDNYFLDLPLNSVATANIEGGYEATRFLLERGFKRIGFLGQTHSYTAYRERYRGYKMALSDAEVSLDESWVLTDIKLFRPDLDTNKILHTLTSQSLDAIFCASDRVAIQLLGKLHANGFSIPQDISVMGFDDIENADIVSPPLTTMRVSRNELGQQAACLLVSQIESKCNYQSSISIYPKLVVRESVADRVPNQSFSK